MDSDYVFIPDVIEGLRDIPADSIISRSLYADDQVKVTLFRFAPGQELTEHTASRPAALHFLEGRARLTLGEDTFQVGPGTWVHMPANLKHGIQAETSLVMLLQLFLGPER